MDSKAVRRVIAVYLAVVALAVTVQFMGFPFYGHEPGGGFNQRAINAWLTLDALQAVGLALAAVTAFREKRRRDADPVADFRRWMGANAVFYGAVLMLIALLPNWFHALSPAPAAQAAQNWTIWHLLNTLLPVLFTVEAFRLWRGSDV